MATKSVVKDYDFSGWATKNDLLCSDGRTIRRDAFAEQDGMKVPLVWNHDHSSPNNVCGHAILENRPEGVYAYAYCNNTEAGQNAKECANHGDIESFSIYANHLTQTPNRDVVRGSIKEVSLVIAGANPGACIVEPIVHSGDTPPVDEAQIYTGDVGIMLNSDKELQHAEETEFDLDAAIDSMTEDQLKAVSILLNSVESEADDKTDDAEDTEDDSASEESAEMAHSEEEDTNEETSDTLAHAEKDGENDEETVADVLATLTDKQKKAVAFMLEQAANGGTVEHSDKGETNMKYNVFSDGKEAAFISHSEEGSIIASAKAHRGSLAEEFKAAVQAGALAHADGDGDIEYSTDKQAYGVNDPDFLFPDAKSMNNPPEWIKRDTDWVADVLQGAHHTPFSRIKSQFANITEDEARAKGYIKGNLKKEEVFSLLKRTTSPQTIYKKQKLDRDDILDITDFDVVAWIKGEMRIMLDEEIARAILIGDGRLASDNDKISEEHIRPIWKDADLFTIKYDVTAGADDASTASEIIDGAVRARKTYKGSGNPTYFTTEDWLTEMLLLKDGLGYRLYKSTSELATAMRVNKIVTVPVMEGVKDAAGKDLAGIIVNMKDYNVGADKGGAVSLFEDFDIDYNQEKYLIETRCSGALVKPYSAIALKVVSGS